MRKTRVWARLLGLQRAVVENMQIGDEGEIVVAARPRWRERDRCGICRLRSPGFDQGDGRRRWRALDLGTTRAFVEAEAPRVTCRRGRNSSSAVDVAGKSRLRMTVKRPTRASAERPHSYVVDLHVGGARGRCAVAARGDRAGEEFADV